jgi:ribose transport system permease protein
MARLLGVLLMVAALYFVLLGSSENARTLNTQRDIADRLGFYGILTVGVAVLIISGGIDLSIGSVVGLGAVCYGLLLQRHINPYLSVLIILAGSMFIGLCHGLLVTRLRLQPFLVTLCGLFIYRGLARWLSSTSVGLSVDADQAFLDAIETLRNLLVKGQYLGVPQVLVVLVVVSTFLALFLHGTRYGRYLFAIGANEEAARYAGIPTERYKILAYVICSATPTSAGSWLELYAITGAVLGGCSLRGGEGTVPGAFLGAAVLPLLRMLCSFGGISNEIEYAVIGAVLLVGTIIDEMLKRRAARRG